MRVEGLDTHRTGKGLKGAHGQFCCSLMEKSPSTPLLGGPSREHTRARKNIRSAAIFVVALACVALCGLTLVGLTGHQTPIRIELEDVAKGTGGTELAKDDLQKVHFSFP